MTAPEGATDTTTSSAATDSEGDTASAVATGTEGETTAAVAPDEPTRKRHKVEGDIRCGAVSRFLSVEQHKHLLMLYRSFPSWPRRKSQEPELTRRRKWAAIEAEMKACFPGLEVKKKYMQSMCQRGKQMQELNELVAFKREHERGEAGAQKVKEHVDAMKLQQEAAVLREAMPALKQEHLEVCVHWQNKAIDDAAKMKQVVNERTERTQELNEAKAKVDSLLSDVEYLDYKNTAMKKESVELHEEIDYFKNKYNKMAKKNAYLAQQLESVHADLMQSLRAD